MSNLTMMTDLYQLTMMQGYFVNGKQNRTAVFDLFYRENPFNAAFSIAAGLEQAIDYIENLHFSEEDIAYLRGLKIFQEDFLDNLKDFHFTGDVWAIPEGSVILPREPLVRVTAPIMQAQLIETALLCLINHQSLIATKAERVCHAAKGDPVMEFGLRRAQGPDAGTLGARAAIIGGCVGTSNVLTSMMYGTPPKGTHAHSWVMSFDTELEAFRAYADIFPDNCLLLVDTYNTLESGVPNAIKVFEELRDKGIHPKFYGIRLDSGDLAYLSIQARKMLDEAGFTDATISASSDLDEHLISALKQQNAKITLWGVGTKLITAQDNPSFGGVYKMCAEADTQGKLMPKIKLSNNVAKVTNPGVKKILRIYDRETGYMRGDLICLEDEVYDTDQPLEIFDPEHTWKRTRFEGGTYTLREMLVPVFKNGKKVYESPALPDIQAYCQQELSHLWPESKRLVNAQELYVDLSKPLYDLKEQMLHQYE